MIPASVVSSPVALIRTRRLPSPFTLPPITSSPGSFETGVDSPVIIDSLTFESPASTTPSAGTLAPGRTSTRSPSSSSVAGTSSISPGCSRSSARSPSSTIRSAVSGMSFASSSSALEARRTLRISIQWPSSMTSMSVTSSQKNADSVGTTTRDDDAREAVDERDADRHRDERHHSRRAIS